MVKAILFDCFGVLYPDTYWTMAREFLGDRLPAHQQDLHCLVRQVDLGMITRDDLWKHFAEIVGVTKEDVYERLDMFGGLDQRLLSFIEERRNHYKFGMISNVGQGFIDRMFVEKPVSVYFDDIVLSSDVGLVKPDRRIYELAAERLGIECVDCLFIDDLEKNVEGAHQAGMQALHYTDFDVFMSEVKPYL